ncbi:ATP-binding protein [Metabacillus litoralis]|uniref:sensor histidine kinase n=1 Tax=Metabacillus litoralis TaxID=152268 RepID=UPI001E585440|nr:ATP-binding protein [Metabacillus litoralis]UHA59879.1 ATP-binding protein [Metabacillus litoralis]
MGKREKDQLIITVLDNGKGISESRLDEIHQSFLENKANSSGNGTNIGLRNIYLRLKLYYGEQASLQIENHENYGTLVTIKLPVESGGLTNESNHN